MGSVSLQAYLANNQTMKKQISFTIVITSLIVALGGLLMGFDASVISGVVQFIEPEFGLTKLELGWSVASLTLTATLAMLFAGPLSDRFGRRAVLRVAAILYAVSAVASAMAPDFITLVIARMLGGFGVGASLILAPMYIAEISPPNLRGRMVSINQLNIVIGISLAFFSNYLILRLGDSNAEWVKTLGLAEHNWRWMLGLEAVPAILYFFGLFLIPRSPRWLVMKGHFDEAVRVMQRYSKEGVDTRSEITKIKESLSTNDTNVWHELKELLSPALRLVLTIGLVVGILQQITGINSVFFYAPMIFEQSGIGTDASFIQAILVGLTNLAFTVVAMLVIDKLGRKPLLSFGVTGIAVCMFLLSYGFSSATYTLTDTSVEQLGATMPTEGFQELIGVTYDSDLAFKAAAIAVIGEETFVEHKNAIVKEAISINPTLILIAILGFVASFAMSVGPVMWVLFSEMFPNSIRGVAISVVGLVNSAVSFLVQWIFPWELDVLGNAVTFLIYGVFAVFGLVFIIRVIPETKGKSLEELEQQLVKK
jgi:sugar porter (SP) family MFS transporter